MVLKENQRMIETYPWGQLTWYASEALGNTDNMTLGECLIKPGKQNSRHYHPNCTEILYVLQGTIIHEYEGKADVIMNAGDTITIPRNIKHFAKNIGDHDAIMLISFSSGARKTIQANQEE
ncbi:MAG: cupin domain-containing protein [Bacilli bacterium]|nr:cupin domain-containing protein [Bacilli bacterium]MBN2696899.1 cupin domain-containing protein [Bacilli bacterium]